MSSRDGSGRPGGNDRPSNHRRTSGRPTPRRNRTNEPWDIDPAEIDRYLSGRPTREQEASGNARSRRQQDRGTAGQLNQLRQQRSQRAPETQRPSRPASTGRQQFVEPEQYDDVGYEAYPEPEPDSFDYDDMGYEDERYVDPAPPPPRRRRAPRREAREPIYQDDEELYEDDPYLTYDDELDRSAPPPRRRQRAQVSRPNMPAMPKLSVPKSISDAELVNDIPSLGLIGGIVLSMAIMAIIVSNRLDQLPAIIPTHVSASGVGEALRGRNALWSVPLLAGALSLMNIGASWFLARFDMFAARFLLGASLLVQFVAWIAVFKYLW